jgi:sporulation protein YlmC with PRC-barrel domain
MCAARTSDAPFTCNKFQPIDARKQIVPRSRNLAPPVGLKRQELNFPQRRPDMLKLASTALVVVLAASTANAQQQTVPAATPGGTVQIQTTIPADAITVTHWYKQNVYDPSDNKIGEIMDVLLSKDGKVETFIVGVGGFLGAGEKDVAVPFNAVEFKIKNNNKWYPVMNTTKDALKNASGFKYDRTAMTWMPENAPATTGGPNPAPRR